MYERLLKPRSTHKRYYKSTTVLEGDVAKITMANGLVTLVDARFADVVSEWSWHDNGAGYARNSFPGSKVYLHRFVLWLSGVECGRLQVDHINNNRADNRLCNLRVVSRSENQCNRPTVVAASGFRGVTWDRGKRKWCAVIKRNRKMKFLGHFTDKTEAAKAYDRAAIAHGGVYRLNFEE